MTRCKICDEEFQTEEEGKQHLFDIHSDLIDEKLMEYMPDAEKDAEDDYLESD